jgi:hypothetical protein
MPSEVKFVKHQAAKSIGILAPLVLLLCGCGGPRSPSIGLCFEPSYNLTSSPYTIVRPGASIGAYTRGWVLPAGDWKIDSIIPVTAPDRVDNLVTRRGNEVWMIVEKDDETWVYRYRTDTHQWTAYTSIDKQPVVPDELIVAPDGTLWGIDWINQKWHLVDYGAFPMLSRYDDAADEFRFVKVPDGILRTFSSPRFPPMVQIDKSGTLWMILNKGANSPGGLYSYDPGNEKMTHHLPDTDLSGWGSLAIAPNQDVWIFDPTIGVKLIDYHPSTGQYNNTFMNLTDRNIKNWSGDLFFDRTGKLWSGIDGWIDFSNPNDPVINSSSLPFSTMFSDGDGDWTWGRPSAMFQSSNGWYWFSFIDAGTVRLDARTGQWCKFTSAFSFVIEDPQGNIRIVADGKLYVLKTRF